MTFREMQVKLDATLLAYRTRILHNQGYAPHCIAKKMGIPVERVHSYLQGVYCIAKTPVLPKRICPKSSKVWGVPVLRIACSKERLERHASFHRKSYIPSKSVARDTRRH